MQGATQGAPIPLAPQIGLFYRKVASSFVLSTKSKKFESQFFAFPD